MMIGNVASPLDHAVKMARWNLLAHVADLGHIFDQLDGVALGLAGATHDGNVRKAQPRVGYRPVKHQAIARVVVEMIGRPGGAILTSRQANEAPPLLLGHPDDKGTQQKKANQETRHLSNVQMLPANPTIGQIAGIVVQVGHRLVAVTKQNHRIDALGTVQAFRERTTLVQ